MHIAVVNFRLRNMTHEQFATACDERKFGPEARVVETVRGTGYRYRASVPKSRADRITAG